MGGVIVHGQAENISAVPKKWFALPNKYTNEREMIVSGMEKIEGFY